jgi:uncharacterized protein YdiU (UPF0061 family)
MEALQALFDHTVTVHGLGHGEGEQRVVSLFAEVVRRTLDLMGHWRRVGFVHGVMNTDNMSVLGLTLDYGPYGWLEVYDPDWTPNTTDAGRRRYRFGQQERVAFWNLARFAESLAPLLGRVEPFEEILLDAWQGLERRILGVWLTKLGIQGQEPGDDALVADLESLMLAGETDYILLFRGLADVPDEGPGSNWPSGLRRAFYAEPTPAWTPWMTRWLARAGPGWEGRRARMNLVNPARVLRNWIASEVIDAATAGDTGAIERALDALRSPYSAEGAEERWLARRPDWARQRAGCSMLSCSS